VSTIRAISLDGGLDRQYLLAAIGVILVVLLALSFWPSGDKDEAEREEREVSPEAEQARLGSQAFPTPPMPAGGAVRGGAQPLRFETSRSTVPAGTRTGPQEEA
jgi:NADH-quinone oxidoreductase subunit H